MGIREFYARYMNRPDFEHLPDPPGRLGQGKWVKTAQSPEAPTPPRPPITPKSVPPTPPRGAPNRKPTTGRSRSAKGYRLKDGVIVDLSGNPVDPSSLSPSEVEAITRDHWRNQIKIP